MQDLSSLVSKKVLRFRKDAGKDGEYRLRRPLRIEIGQTVIDQISRIYKKDYENGGLLEFAASTGSLDCLAFHQVPNKSANSTSYNPSAAAFNAKVAEILDRGNLPMAIHTHPTQIGWTPYDQKRVKFYLKSSKPDRHIANKGLTDYLDLPEAIFVKDERFNTGYGIAFYEGQIFPYSITALSNAQIAAGIVAAYYMLRGKLTKLLLAGLVSWFLVEFIRRPVYKYSKDGLSIKLIA